MKNANYTFRIIIEPDEKGTFHGYVPALSGCHTFGATIDETRKNLRDAISVYVSSLIADGEDVPQDNSFESFETVTSKELELNYAQVACYKQ
ncbi:type II toxin-antitoxin system HicB family antitoxin [Candidatus Parcubacteria bacterium]|nr:MAG: type II toxin-antitoxin system HicB family antitoxin [Candidatus Parcubacteria bacterium]